MYGSIILTSRSHEHASESELDLDLDFVECSMKDAGPMKDKHAFHWYLGAYHLDLVLLTVGASWRLNLDLDFKAMYCCRILEQWNNSLTDTKVDPELNLYAEAYLHTKQQDGFGSRI